MAKMQTNYKSIVLLLLLSAASCTLAQSDDEEFLFTNDPAPDTFQLHQRYPDRPETEECRPIRLHIGRGSRRFRSELVTNDHSFVHFSSADARIMSLRLRSRLNELAQSFYDEHGVWLSVGKAWTEQGDSDIVEPDSLHYEGRSVRVTVSSSLLSLLLQLAIEVGFDWVIYAHETYARMSVIPNMCDVSLDMVFMLDRSGSVGEDNFDTAISFLQNVVRFYDISTDGTRVGLVTYSTGATIEFDLNDYESVEEVRKALGRVFYTRGWTATALALGLTRFMLDPRQNYGARPFEDGIPKVAVLLTDGRSNQLPITARANALRDFGVQVYTVGIGDIYVPELRFIASDPDSQHVFLLNSFNDAQSFVDRLSLTTCDTPALVDPGEDTRTRIEEDEFRFFESRCAAFSDTVMIEQIDLVGKSSLYASWSVQNPGPLDPLHSVVRNEDLTNNHRTLELTLPSNGDRFVYVSVRGRRARNEFTLVIWDKIFAEDQYSITILSTGDTAGQQIINLADQIRDTDARFIFEIRSGNDGGSFSLDRLTGILTAVPSSLVPGTYSIVIVAVNIEHSCHRSKVVVNVIVTEEMLRFDPVPQAVSISEATMPGTMVTQVTAISSSGIPPTYSIIAGDPLNQFSINEVSGEIAVSAFLDFEVTSVYSLTVQASGASTVVVMATQVVNVVDVNEGAEFVTECGVMGSCVFSVPEGEPGGVEVGRVEASDPDTLNPQFSMLAYSIQSDVPVPFQVSENGIIRTTETLDFESVDTYLFTLFVGDTGNPPSPPRIQTQVRVNVLDVEENAPPMFLFNCSGEVFENQVAVGDPFLECPASDPDHLANEIVYEIIAGNIDDTFGVDAALGPGVIVANRPLDREDIELYTLTLRVTDPAGLFDTTTFTVRILDENDSPPVCSPPSPTITISISSLPTGGGVATFTASDPDMNPAPPTFSISPETPSNLTSATVVVTVTDGADSALSSTCTLSIQFDGVCERQQYTIDPSSGQLDADLLCSAEFAGDDTVAIPVGRNRRITCDAATNVPVTYQFRHNGTDIFDAMTTNSILLRGVDFDDSGVYDCVVVSNVLGSIVSSPLTVLIQSAPMILMLPTEAEVMVGGTVEIDCVAFGVPDPTITWLRPDGEEVQGTTDPRIQAEGERLNISLAELGDSGDYTCTASNNLGSVSDTITLTVFQAQQLVVAEVPLYSLPAREGSCHEFNSTHFNSILTGITDHPALTTAQASNDLCPPSPCNPSPCRNEGECLAEPSAVGGFHCRCPPQFSGRFCDTLVDPCNRTPCRNNGLCASSSRGNFICYCPERYHGDRCQYTDVCRSSAPCEVGKVCLETVVRSEGYVCVDGEDGEDGSGEGVRVTVEGGESTTIPQLENEVNIYIETAVDERKRRAAMADEDLMEENGFVTVCEGRFVPTATPGRLRLLWACPVGMAEPGVADEAAICALLVEEGLVMSCSSSEGVVLSQPHEDTLPPTRVNITFFLIDPSTGRPLGSLDVLTILEESEALVKLNSTIYRTERFTAVAPSDGQSPPDSRGAILGAVLGTLLAALILGVAVATIIFIVRRQSRNKTKSVEQNYSLERRNGNGTLDSVTFSNCYSQVPQNEDSLLKPPARLPSNGEGVFDDPVYGAGYGGAYCPPDTERRSGSLQRGMRGSLERGMKLIKTRVPSMRRSNTASDEKLLNSSLEDSGDYDDIVAPAATPPHVTTPTSNEEAEPESEIYANIAHHRAGAMGNAGERWQSYWQTRTLIRTDPPQSGNSAHK